MKISIVIPCRNEEKYIGACIESIASAALDENTIEVFVVDGMSDDGTRQVLNELSKKYLWLKLIDNPQRTTPIALNLGIKNTTGELVMILGAHSLLEKNFFQEVLPCFAFDKQTGCVGGLLKNISEDKITESIALAMSSSFGMGNAYFRTGAKDGFVDTVAFGVYKKEVFEKVGLFNEELTRNQDDEFNYRVTKAGYKIYLTAKTSITYYVRSSYKKLFRQFYQYGFWKVYVNQKHKSITTARQLVPFLFVGFLVFGLLTTVLFQKELVMYCATLSIYFLMAIYFALKVTDTFRSFSEVIFCFLIVHLSYGVGYWFGLIRFVLLGMKPNQKGSATKLSR